MRTETKTEQARQLLQQGKKKQAYSLLRGFKIGLTDEDITKIQVTAEALNGNGAFYEKLGYDLSTTETEADQIVNSKIFK